MLEKRQSGLLTDLYELTMAAGYVGGAGGSVRFGEAWATFELFVRSFPARRNFLVAAGLEQALDFLENACFSSEEIAYLRGLPVFRKISPGFFDYLAAFRFTGDAWALPEGTIFFAEEPLLRVRAPIAEGQLVETSLLSILHFQTLIASKAARLFAAAGGRPVIEFGSRRAHGSEAGVLAARAAFIGGCAGTSNVFAGHRFGLPVYGTQAHSWIMAHEDEAEAFRTFTELFPQDAVLLADTYDVRAAVEKIIALGRAPRGIRLDSGDILGDSIWARRRLDQAGWNEVQVFASGDLDEDHIAALVNAGACVDAFGVGTSLVASADAPHLNIIYKLAEIERGGQARGVAKLSEAKKTYPGRKQVFRFRDAEGRFCGDVVGLEDEQFTAAEPLLAPVLRGGRRLNTTAEDSAAAVRAARERFLSNCEQLPKRLLSLEPLQEAFPVRHSERLEALFEQVRKTLVQPASI
jgi:nicotinate phosphoribosyltransferase